MTIVALTTSIVYDNLIAKFRGYFLLANTTGNDIIINWFYLFFYLPTNPTLAHQMFVEQDINLAWPNDCMCSTVHDIMLC